ncbi:hypothetical protein LTR15_012509 [Elasticomyces elasticus]|nr:hypothetical protein LTR15_012509 [Elasticomyces elasticus]
METSPSSADHELHIVIDFETTKLAVGCQIVRKGEPLLSERTKILRLQGDLQEVPQVVGIHVRTEELRWGEDVDEWISSGVAKQEDILPFRRLKACFCDSNEAARVNHMLQTQLTSKNGDSRDVFWLVLRHFKRITKAIDAALCTTYCQYDEAWFASVKRRILLAVPEISTPASNRKLQELMQRVGFNDVALVSETELASAWQLRKYALAGEDVPAMLEDGSEVIIADAGGLTYNVAIYRMRDAASDVPGLTWKFTGQADSAPLGSEQMLTIQCIEVVKKAIGYEHGSSKDGPRRHYMHENRLDHVIRNSFESFKGSGWAEESRKIHVKPSTLEVEIEREEHMDAWIEEAFKGMVEINSRLVQSGHNIKGRLARVTDQVVVCTVWQVFHFDNPDADINPVLEAQVYSINQVTQDSSPVFADDQHTTLLPWIEVWGSPIEYEVTGIREYEAFWDRGDDRHLPEDAGYQIYARLCFAMQGLTVKVFWDVAPPSFRPYANKQKTFRAPKEADLLHLGSRSLHKQSHTAFIQRVGSPDTTPTSDGDSDTHSDIDDPSIRLEGQKRKHTVPIVGGRSRKVRS